MIISQVSYRTNGPLVYWSYCKVVVSTFISVHFASDRLSLDEPVLTLMYIFRLVILTYGHMMYGAILTSAKT